MTPEYEAARLKACRELAARDFGPTHAADIRLGLHDTSEVVTRHFAAFDAGSAHAVAEIVGWLRSCGERSFNVADAIERDDYVALSASEGNVS